MSQTSSSIRALSGSFSTLNVGGVQQAGSLSYTATATAAATAAATFYTAAGVTGTAVEAGVYVGTLKVTDGTTTSTFGQVLVVENADGVITGSSTAGVTAVGGATWRVTTTTAGVLRVVTAGTSTATVTATLTLRKL